jgi:hyperosmotically inducible protein
MKTVALVGVGLLAVTVVACGRDEPNYENLANEALDRANLSEVDADYSTNDRVVHVTGTVRSEADRQRAGDVVQQAVSNKAQVANEVTVEGGHETVADDFDGAIETRLDNRVDLEGTLKDQDIVFDAVNGVVTISGRVATAADKERVGQMAREESGVKQVVNSLEVGKK